MVAHERLTEPHATIKWLLAKRNSLSDIPAFQGPYGKFKIKKKLYKAENVEDLRQNFLTLLAKDDFEAAATYEYIDIMQLRQTVWPCESYLCLVLLMIKINAWSTWRSCQQDDAEKNKKFWKKSVPSCIWNTVFLKKNKQKMNSTRFFGKLLKLSFAFLYLSRKNFNIYEAITAYVQK